MKGILATCFDFSEWNVDDGLCDISYDMIGFDKSVWREHGRCLRGQSRFCAPTVGRMDIVLLVGRSSVSGRVAGMEELALQICSRNHCRRRRRGQRSTTTSTNIKTHAPSGDNAIYRM
jgi:hypothetical protein